MAKNAFLQRQNQMMHDSFQTGVRLGEQRMMDFYAIALSEQSRMKPERIMEIMKAVQELRIEYADAYHKCDESDYMQEKLDCRLNDAMKSGCNESFGFSKRYPMLCEFDYKKGKWK